MSNMNDFSDFDRLLNLDDTVLESSAPYQVHADPLGGNSYFLGHDGIAPTATDQYGLLIGETKGIDTAMQDTYMSPAHASIQPFFGNHLDTLDCGFAPQFSHPPVPCDYCAARGLACFFLNGNETGCSCCRALLRKCTFQSHGPRPGWLDTLDPVMEDSATTSAKTVTTKPLFSHGASMNDVMGEYLKTQPERTSVRFPRSITLVLKRWLEAHADNPYPTDEEKLQMQKDTGLSLNQISTWLANARRRSKTKCRRAASPHPTSRSRPMSIPSDERANLNPFERWKSSPPEKEAPLNLIKEAAETIQIDSKASGSSSRTHSRIGRSKRSSDSSAVSNAIAPSVSSFDTTHSNSLDSSRASSIHSYGSYASLNSRQSKIRRRRRNIPRPTLRQKADSGTIYYCTFCTDSFHIKYDWSRHEKSMHMNLEKWVCHPLGPVIVSSSDGTTTCVYCQAPNPDRDHLDTHGHAECSEKDTEAHTFYRKDHLRQHLKLMHNMPLQPWMEDWRIAPPIVRSRCGLCPVEAPATFTTWQDRVDHIAKHFKDGITMRDWTGDHGFDAEIAAQVTNAMPPFMIDQERTTPDPFSAANGHRGLWTTETLADVAATIDEQHVRQLSGGPLAGGPMPKVSNCWTILTTQLGLWLRQQLEAGVVPADEIFQREARIIVFDDDDSWNQTAADNPQWLTLFKRAHGLLPSEAGTNGKAKAIAQGAPMVETHQEEMIMDDGIFAMTLDDGQQDFGQLFERAGMTMGGSYE